MNRLATFFGIFFGGIFWVAYIRAAGGYGPMEPRISEKGGAGGSNA